MNRDKFKSLLKDNNQAKTKAELENDPFLSDALEGYGTLDIQDLKKLDKRFYKNRGILNFSLVILFVSTFAIGGLIFKKDTSKRSSIIDKNTPLTQSKANSNLVKIKNDTIIVDKRNEKELRRLLRKKTKLNREFDRTPIVEINIFTN